MLGNKQLTFSKKLLFLFLLLIVSALLFTLVITGWLAESWKKFLIGCFLLWFLLFLLKLIRLIIRVFWACWLLHRWEQNIFQYDHQSHIAWMWLNDLFHRELYRATHQFHYFSSFRSCTDSVKKHMGNVAPETTSMLCKNTNWNFAEGLHCWKYIPCIKLAHLKPTTTRIHCSALDHYTPDDGWCTASWTVLKFCSLSIFKTRNNFILQLNTAQKNEMWNNCGYFSLVRGLSLSPSVNPTILFVSVDGDIQIVEQQSVVDASAPETARWL